MGDDASVSLYPPGGLYLKPESRIHIQVRLPEIRNPGVTVSNWEVMEKLKAHAHPEKFNSLRVTNSSRETIRFEGEFSSVKILKKVVLVLNKKTIKLKGFSDSLKVNASPGESTFPTQSEWERYFQDRGVDTFDDGRPGERPDTVHIRGLPIKWFTSQESGDKPCPNVLRLAFQKFGNIRQVGFYDPSCSTTASSSTKSSEAAFSSFGPGAGAEFLNFEAYIQYEDYKGFCSAMSSLKGMLLSKTQGDATAQLSVAKIKVEFDKSGFLSERSIRKRRHVEERKRKEKEEEEKKLEAKRRHEEQERLKEQQEKEKEEEERRKAKAEEKQKKKKEQLKVAAELRAVAVQRRTEAQRLMSVLLAGAAEARYQQEQTSLKEMEAKKQQKLHEEQQKKEEELRDTLLQNVQKLEQKKLSLQRELLLRSVEGSDIKSAIVTPDKDQSSSGNSSSSSSKKHKKRKRERDKH